MLDETTLQNIKSHFGIIGNSEPLNRAIKQAHQVAGINCAVLIEGESGVGKENIARIIHQYSARKNMTYVALNCGTMDNETVDSSLFGHKKGSFTGAIADHKGFFETADGGTIFLDEVGELPLDTQARLLRVLENGEYIPLGESLPKKTNVRIIAATNVSLNQAMAEGRFRQDLYYRLCPYIIRVPALRERKEDIVLLFRKFVADFAEAYQKPIIRLSEGAKDLLLKYPFNGNIRELKSVATTLCIQCEDREISGAMMQECLDNLSKDSASQVPVLYRAPAHDMSANQMWLMIAQMKQEILELQQAVTALAQQRPVTPTTPLYSAPLSEKIDDTQYQPVEEVKVEDDAPKSLKENEKQILQAALERHKGNRKAACAEVGMSERTLYRKIKEYGL